MGRFGDTEKEKDLYEYEKLKALRATFSVSRNKNIYKMLDSQYAKNFSSNNLKLFASQKKEKKLDRFDLTILLKSMFEKHQKFEIKRQYNTIKNGEIIRKVEKTSVEYSLMIIDEFQNYLPEQLEILKSCLNTKTQSVVYVGDMAQQVKLGTIRDWSNVREVVSPDRNITLNKVYRNTKNILSFIKTLGYKVELPQGLKEGPEVVEKLISTSQEEIEYIKGVVGEYSKGSIGILAKDESYLEDFKTEFKGEKNIHLLSMLEAQGVEFDLVCIVGVTKESFQVTHHEDVLPEHIEERKRMQRDLLYVALTRAITELHILGKERLSDCI